MGFHLLGRGAAVARRSGHLAEHHVRIEGIVQQAFVVPHLHVDGIPETRLLQDELVGREHVIGDDGKMASVEIARFRPQRSQEKERCGHKSFNVHHGPHYSRTDANAASVVGEKQRPR